MGFLITSKNMSLKVGTNVLNYIVIDIKLMPLSLWRVYIFLVMV